MREQTLPGEQAALALYYQRGLTPALGEDGRPNPHEFTLAEPRRDMDPRVAALLGLSPNQVPSPEEIAQILAGNRADGGAIPGKQVQRETRSLADELGLDGARTPKPEEIARVLEGCRADDGAHLPARKRTNQAPHSRRKRLRMCSPAAEQTVQKTGLGRCWRG